jgi:hypothetical protein
MRLKTLQNNAFPKKKHLFNSSQTICSKNRLNPSKINLILWSFGDLGAIHIMGLKSPWSNGPHPRVLGEVAHIIASFLHGLQQPGEPSRDVYLKKNAPFMSIDEQYVAFFFGARDSHKDRL